MIAALVISVYVAQAQPLARALSPDRCAAVVRYAVSNNLAYQIPDRIRGAWVGSGSYRAGDIVIHNGSRYLCVQSHTAQQGWQPPSTPALWAVMRPPLSPWVQPTGAHDAYAKGAIVMHNGIRWRSTIDNNVWEPGIYGWESYKRRHKNK